MTARDFLRLLPLCLAAGCVAKGAIKVDLPALEASPKSAARVVLARQPGPPESLIHRELPWAKVHIDLTAYPEAAAAMLGGIFTRVEVASSAAQAQGADFIVSLATDYPRTVGLIFRDAAGTQSISFSCPGWAVPPSPEADSLIVKILTPPGMIVSFGALGLGYAYRAHEALDAIKDHLSTATAQALQELRAQIMASPVLKKAAAAPPPAAPACSRPLEAGEVAQQAREFFERGRNYLDVAKSAEDYAAASSELEKSLALAPCWASAQLSCALAQEGARQWKRAAEHLRAYLALNGEAGDAEKMRQHLLDLESRP